MRLRLTLALLASTALAGCGGHAHKTGGPDEAVTTFSTASNRVNSSFAAIGQLALRNPAALRSAALANLASRNPDVRYAAVYGLSLTATRGESLDALARILRSHDVTERVLAAETLTAQGDKRGVPVLIDSLDSQKAFAHWAPPRRAGEVAQHALLRFVPSPRLRLASKEAWRRWWARHGVSVRLKPVEVGAP
jgi:HEAT repeat protein